MHAYSCFYCNTLVDKMFYHIYPACPSCFRVDAPRIPVPTLEEKLAGASDIESDDESLLEEILAGCWNQLPVSGTTK